MKQTSTTAARARHRNRYWSEYDIEEYRCPDCGRGRDEVRRFELHHKDGNPRNGARDNLIGVCQTCHHVRHGAVRWKINLEAWKAAFLALGDDPINPPRVDRIQQAREGGR